MKPITFLALLFVIAAVTVTASKVRYDNHTVIRVNVPSNFESHNHFSKVLNKLKIYNIQQWSGTDFMCSRNVLSQVENVLKTDGFKYDILIRDVQVHIDREQQHRTTVRVNENFMNLLLSPNASDSYFSDYRSNDEVNNYLSSLVSQYPTLVTKESIGQTYENNTIWAYTVNGKNGGNKTGIYFECGIHAREWIAQTTCVYILNALVTKYGQDTHITKLVDSLTWYIVPIVNVDGYIYTWTTDRMWRKTRTPNKGTTCIGVDPNRNWDSHFCEVGASSDPCDDAYCGPSPFSELCVKHVSDFILQHPNIQVFIDFHSYSQMWMAPYGYVSTPTKDGDIQQKMGLAATAAITKSSGLTYAEGTIYNTVYPASGSSADWGYDVAHVKFSYGVELRDQGQYGFVLPATQIVPAGEEILAASLVMGDFLLTNPEGGKIPVVHAPRTATF